MLKNRKVVGKAVGEVEFQVESMAMPELPSKHVLVKNLYSLISTGTELACVNGFESSWFHMPSVLGYCSVGEIYALADDADSFQVGDLVYNFSGHQEYSVLPTTGCIMKVPQGFETKYVPLARMATIAASAIRVSDIEFGDYVAVTGQGIIGIMAAQLAKLQGAFVVGIGRHEARLSIAKRCGVDLVLNSRECDLKEEIEEFTRGHGIDTFIEAIGKTDVALNSFEHLARNGELILLGTPRTEYKIDASPILSKIFNSDWNYKIKGAHEWRDPCEKNNFVKHSIVRNTEIIFRMMAEDRLCYKPLLTHTVKPEDCSSIYEDISKNKNKYLGVVFDWTK